MENASTGCALLKNFYPNFLKESYEPLKLSALQQAHQEFIDIANLWTEISELFLRITQTKDKKHIALTSEILKH